MTVSHRGTAARPATEGDDVSDDKVHAEVDHVLDQFDTMLTAGRFADADASLAAFTVGSVSLSALVAILGITIKAKPRLPARSGFYDRVYAEVAQQKGRKYAKQLLTKYW